MIRSCRLVGFFRALAVLIALLIAGCASRTSAPVIDRGPDAPRAAATAPSAAGRNIEPRAETYTVKRGDTLYGIALDSGNNYRDLAEWNGLSNPNLIREGQVLRLSPPGTVVQTRPLGAGGSVESRPLETAAPADPIKSEPRAVKLPYSDENHALLMRDGKPAAPAPKPVAPAKPLAESRPAIAEQKPPPGESKPAAEEDDDKIEWGWPTLGRLLAGFSEATNKGLDIGGKAGQAVLASASGTVLYVGSGIRGYGKLIVVRHSRSFSSVYAHNNELLVKEGQRVVKGQKIAEMGNSDTDQVKLHFEIRRLGKPVDPARLLPERQ